MKRRFHTIAWLLLGLLAVSAVLISIGKREEVTDPRVDSYGPSGLSAFADLLRANGYRVSIDGSSVPQLGKDDVVIAALNEKDPEAFESSSNSVFGRITDFAKKGGHVILLPMEPYFSQASPSVKSTTALHVATGASYPLSVRDDLNSQSARNLLSDMPAATLWRDSGASEAEIAALIKLDKGLVLAAGDGYMAVNRFIDKDSNADALMNMVQTVAPKGSRLVFTEATYTQEDPGLIEMLGPGAAGAWYQILFFLFPVIIFTLGKRFGLPEEVRTSQAGQRELVNAIADSYRRARSTRTACRSTYDRADTEVRKVLRLSSDAPASERDLNIPPALALEFKRVFEGSIDTLPAKEAFERCRQLQRQVKLFLGKSA
jgi:hypothetical protein